MLASVSFTMMLTLSWILSAPLALLSPEQVIPSPQTQGWEDAPSETPSTAPQGTSDNWAQSPDESAATPPATVPSEPAPGPAQETKRRRLLGFYAGFDTRLAALDSRFSVFLGGSGGLILLHRFVLGGAGYGLASHDKTYSMFGQSNELTMGYGGGVLGFYAVKTARINIGVSSIIGGGKACTLPSTGGCSQETSFFIAEPEAGIYLNLTHFLRIGLMGGYRIIAGADDWSGPDSYAMSGGSGSIKIELGRFADPRRGTMRGTRSMH